MINRIELPEEIIIASQNPGKVKEINILLNDKNHLHELAMPAHVLFQEVYH